MRSSALFLALGAPSALAAVTKPHILLIVADDLGWNDVSFHAPAAADGTRSAQIPTPHLTALASEGIVLDNFYVQPVCSPTRASLMTGRHVIHTGIYDPDCSFGTTLAVPTAFSMLPQHLKALGYATHAIGKWHLGDFAPQLTPTGRGFDTFYGYYDGAEEYFSHTIKNYVDLHNDSARPGGWGLAHATGQDGAYSTHIYTEQAERVIASHAAASAAASAASDAPPPLFMYLAYQAIHSPDEVPQSYRDPFNATIPDTPADPSKVLNNVGNHRRTVAGMVAALDEGVGNVTAALKAAGMFDDTLIFFTADNGGPAAGFNSNMASNWPLRGMKRTLWEGGMRVSAFAHGAGLRKTGYVNEAMVHACDVPESMLALAANGLEADPSDAGGWIGWREHPALKAAAAAEPPFQLGDGIDNWAALATGAPSARTEMIHEAHPSGHGQDDGNGQAIRVGDYKLITEKGPMWHGPPNDEWYESGSNPAQYSHTVSCGGPPPNASAPGYCDPAKLPCLFNVRLDPCEFRDLSKDRPDVVANLTARLAVYQATAVHKSFHQLKGVNCSSSDPKDHPEWDGFWQPNCQGVESGRRRRARAALN